MPIEFHRREGIFRLETPGTTYLMGLAEDGSLGHVYYGPSVPDNNMGYLMRTGERPLGPWESPRERASFDDVFPFEYPAFGGGDFREPCLRVRDAQGAESCALRYEGHVIRPGKPPLPGLPAAYGGAGECDTLELTLQDPVLKLRVTLSYTVFRDTDAICRSARIENAGGGPVTLTAALSASLELDNEDFDVLTLPGSWARERTIDRRRLSHGPQGAHSLRGISSHQFSPSIILAQHTATQERGLVYGGTLVYSGNFLTQAELDQFERVRVVLGIHPQGFGWRLEPGESFQTPEAVLVCSEEGLGGMSRVFHDFMRRHLIRGQGKHRPSLVNSWESFYFDFNTEKLLDLGRAAAECGIELLVVDDGWFGARDDDNSSLGDWRENTGKLPGGLRRLGEELGAMGVALGIWVEPEMVSKDSDLYRAHPDYAMTIPGREPALARNQLVLDLTRREVRECVYSQISALLRSAPIKYVKWDMNRPLTDVYTPSLPPERQGETAHRYMLGVYELQERLVTDFPDVLLENCSSGGARFDAGMLYYSPQIWTSDNTEAADRLRIQEGAALIFPLSSMGAHVAACPSHINGRVTPFETRGRVSLTGAFGYELDITKLTPAERALIPVQLEEYKKYGPVFREGDYYRLASWAGNGVYDALMSVTKDKSLAVVVFVQVLSRTNCRSLRLRLQGLEGPALYRDTATGEVRSGFGWMRGGLLLGPFTGDFVSKLTVLERVETEK